MTSGIYKRKDVSERFSDKYCVNSTTGCWEWKKPKPSGYGQFYHKGTMRHSHIVSYELNTGTVPEGSVIDHLCRVKCCCNPEHLEAVTQKVNVRRGLAGESCKTRASLQTHCKWGHKFTEQNTYVSKQGARHCRKCHKKRETLRREVDKHLTSEV